MPKAILMGLLATLAVLISTKDGAAQNQDSVSVSFETFAEWCLNQGQLAPETQHTINVLLSQAETQACDSAAETLANMTELWL
ncbi:MAG: leucine-rich repeat domain-containing protein, partial [Leptolyngbya sp. SIO1D8]|nr:leucine-rich repeat domain-containing protein [Leptolyngbya sp. SIO1D8]